MDWIRDYFQWIFAQDFTDIIGMLIVTAVAAALAALAILWTMVGIKWALGIGQYRRRPETPRRIRRHAKTERLRDLKAQGLSVRQIHEELRRTG